MASGIEIPYPDLTDLYAVVVVVVVVGDQITSIRPIGRGRRELRILNSPTPLRYS